MKTYNLFISHSWSYSDDYERLKNLLEKRGYFNLKNYSVPRDRPIKDKDLYDGIRDKIRICHVVLVPAGVYASHSDWIQKEIEIAKNEFSNPKPVLAIEPRGSEKTSEFVKKRADLTVHWNTESIVSAIRELA